MTQSPLDVPARPATWTELAVALLAGFVLGASTCGTVTKAMAGGPTVVSWDQGADCASITGWELVQAPITTAQPNPQPTAGSIGASIANTGTPPCGLAMTRTVTLAGVGPTRFWIRAVAGATKSIESNSADAALPLASPGQLRVAP